MLYIQDFSFSQSYSIHEALIDTFSSSISGYGAYAFASASGVNILFNDKEFEALLERGKYSLIVGIDAITDVRCLDSLSQINYSKPNFSAQAFYHNNKGSLFHPKVSFFRHVEGGGTLIAGSGNLTLGGLRKNREAFSVITLSESEFDRMENYWAAWLTQSANSLRDLSDMDVIAKVTSNIQIVKAKAQNKEVNDEITPVDKGTSPIMTSISEGWCFDEDSQVLVAEIPKSGNRWMQANFDVQTFKSFFGATPGDNSQRILLRNLNYDSSLSDVEVRPSVSVKSKNYRFELDAARGVTYPSSGKPIGIFIQLTTRMFLYHLFMPEHFLYHEIFHWLATNWSGRVDRMKRVVTTAVDLDKILSQSVFQHYKM